MYILQRLGFLALILMSMSSSAYAQTLIKGFVHSDQKSLSDVSIQLNGKSGKKYQAVSTAQGSFQLEVINDEYQASFAKAGYQSQSLKIDAQGKTIDLKINLKAMNDQSKDQKVVTKTKADIASSEKAAQAVVTATPSKESSINHDRIMASKPMEALGVKGYGRGKSMPSPASVAHRGGPMKRANSMAPPPSPLQQSALMMAHDRDENRDAYAKINENEFTDVSASPLSTFSIDVDTASYANVRSYLERGQKPHVDSVKIEERINYFDYQYPAPKEDDEHPFSIYTELSTAPWNPKHQLLHIGLQGLQIDKSKLPRSNLVFLIDVSGSMSAPNKLPLLKQAFALLVENLTEKDKVSIVVYAGAAGLVLPPTPASDKATILNAFAKLQAGGSTAGGAGIELAYKVALENKLTDGNNRVILATDGDFNVGTQNDNDLIRLIEEKRKSGVFLTVLGFGMGNYQDQKMSILAEKGNGNQAYIDSLFEAKKVLVKEMGGTLLTIAKDVKLQVEFNPAQVAQYRLIGYESRVLAAKDFNDDTKDAGELGAGHSVTALYEIIPVNRANPLSTPQVDDLKYQKKGETIASNDWVNIKFRYKKPNADQSILLAKAHQGETPWDQTSNDFKFSSAVAMFGMLLGQSKHAGASNYELVRKIASQALNEDSYRMDFLELVKKAMLLPQ